LVFSTAFCQLHYADLLTPWRRALLEKLTGSQLLEKGPAFYGTQRFPYRVYRCPQCVPILNQLHSGHTSTFPLLEDPSSRVRLDLPSGLFPSGFPTKTMYTRLLSPYMLQSPPISILSPEQYWVRNKVKVNQSRYRPGVAQRVPGS